MLPYKDAGGKTNTEDQDQTAPLGAGCSTDLSLNCLPKAVCPNKEQKKSTKYCFIWEMIKLLTNYILHASVTTHFIIHAPDKVL